MASQLRDSFGRKVDYLRLSVTDRCDFRCVYCMAEDMRFVPRAQVLTLEECEAIAKAFVNLGVRRIRLTGGEPLVRRGIVGLAERLGAMPGLDELTITTNGSQLRDMAMSLQQAGVRRLNISLDSLQAERFQQMTRTGSLDKVLAGIEAAARAGFERVKLNAVILKGRNDDEVLDLVEFARRRELDLSFIEEMPLGAIVEHSRQEAFMASEEIRALIEAKYSLQASAERTGGPSRYWRLAGEKTRIGFISPHSQNFCHLCNRVRLTAEGRLLLCLGNEHSVDLRAVVRAHPGDTQRLEDAIIRAIQNKPETHHFSHSDEPEILRFMNTTGG